MITEQPGDIMVPYYLEGTSSNREHTNVGLIEIVRPIVKDPKTGKQGNFVLLELPRGFAKNENLEEAAKRELIEETGVEGIKKIEYIGSINSNTTYFTELNPVFAIEVYPNKLNKNSLGDGFEKNLKM